MKLKKRLAWVLILALLLLTMLPAGASLAAATEPAAEETTETAPPAAPTEEPAATEPEATMGTSSEDAVLWSAGSGKSLCLLLSDRANESETAAADLLADYLAQATGETPEILAVGTVDYLEKNGKDNDVGAYIVLSVTGGDAKTGSYTVRLGADGNLYIDADDARGLFNGAYAFLREFCGVNLYSADVKTVGQVDRIAVPAGYEKTYVPALEYADTDWISPHDPDFAVANGLNGIYSPIPAEMGGKVNYITFCHSLTTAIVPENELLESHPEYFALQEDGKRIADQLCLSNPNVVNRAIEDVLRLIDEGYDETAPLNIISVTQDDNQNYCTCENCAAIAERYGGQSGLMLWFVNQIADAVAASDHPDVVVDTFAYQYTRHAPVGITPKDNVCVRLCSIECCFAHALDDPACEENAAFMQDLRDWAALSDRLYIWDYTTNYSATLGLFPNFGVLQKNIQAFVRNSVVGVYEEGAYYAGECNTEFADLRAYLLARFLQNPDEADPVGLRDGFLAAYYGEGAAEIGEFLDYITAHAGNAEGHLAIGQNMATSLHGVTSKDAKAMDALWDAAYEKANAAGNTEAAARIDRSRTSWEYYKACAEVGAYRRGINVLGWIRANAALWEKLDAQGVTRYNEGKTLNEVKRTSLLNPNEWSQISGVWYAICLCLVTAAVLFSALAALVCFKKHKLTVLLPVMAVALIPLGVIARDVFRKWENVGLYFALTAVMGLIVSLYAVYAAWAMGGFEKLPAKKPAISCGIGAVIAIGVYHIVIFIMNNVILNGSKPAYAICVGFSWLAFLVIADTSALLICYLVKRKKKS
ncbi:MAG: DUF4838 domain-containing protein [Clostridia bacterium]|nr:DUF4838 domain-containing protein [Clostridia bacterium]